MCEGNLSDISFSDSGNKIGENKDSDYKNSKSDSELNDGLERDLSC